MARHVISTRALRGISCLGKRKGPVSRKGKNQIDEASCQLLQSIEGRGKQ